MVFEIIVGVSAGAAIAFSAHILKFDQDRSFYPTILIVIASCYVLFAMLAQQGARGEIIVSIVFIALAIAGHIGWYWIVGLGFFLHGFYDLGHALWGGGGHLPERWAGFCFGADLILGGGGHLDDAPLAKQR